MTGSYRWAFYVEQAILKLKILLPHILGAMCLEMGTLLPSLQVCSCRDRTFILPTNSLKHSHLTGTPTYLDVCLFKQTCRGAQPPSPRWEASRKREKRDSGSPVHCGVRQIELGFIFCQQERCHCLPGEELCGQEERTASEQVLWSSYFAILLCSRIFSDMYS